ncbi:DUF6777 domain-containing protein [Streptomyces galbus]|uniref:DUF6777 domain-containing protein n=1 Tax=Streptomyces galbus TaxID=33898 RepID=UPI001582CD9D|nr:DUF6777 domain-containing protein [Streptomyces galbus]GHD24821.1 hypothetical protein GCM10010335_09270 [Streptomyces galbus]
MRPPRGVFVLVCALAVTFLVAGCGGSPSRPGEQVVLRPVAAQGPDAFTRSTVTSLPVLPAPATTTGDRPPSVSGGTPGLYGGVQGVAGCDVERQIALLTADRAKADAFARAEGVATSAVPGHVRALTPVVLRADTRVTDHGYRDGRATPRQAVLQAGTAVLVDDRGVPRLRCACGNPLRPPAATPGTPNPRSLPWPDYRPGRVVAVTPAPRALTRLTLVDVVTRAWIERSPGPDASRDRALPAPAWSATSPASDPQAGGVPPPARAPLNPAAPPRRPRQQPVPAAPDLTATAPDPADDTGWDLVDGLGPVTVPDLPDVPDGGGLIPDDLPDGLPDGLPDTPLDGALTGLPGGSDPADPSAGAGGPAGTLPG